MFPSLDLLKIVASIGVIILHLNNPDNGNALGMAVASENWGASTLLIVLECCSISAVNIFLIISGFFLSKSKKRRVSKIIYMFVLCSGMSVICYVLKGLLFSQDIFWNELMLRTIPNNYYITLYSVLYYISPLINRALEGMDYKRLLNVIIQLVFIFAGVPTILAFIDENTGVFFNGLCTIGSGGSQSGYTIVNFMLMYCLGFTLRKLYDLGHNLKLRYSILLYDVSVVSIFIWEYRYFLKTQNMWSYALAYCNIFVVLEAVSLFYVFLALPDIWSKKDTLVRIISDFAKSSLVAYLFHSFLISFIPIKTVIENHNSAISILILLLECVAIYFACFILWKIISLIRNYININVKTKSIGE